MSDSQSKLEHMEATDSRTPGEPTARARAAFRALLKRLGEDPVLAVSWATLYGELDAGDRHSLLGLVEEEVARRGLDPIATFAPLLAAESDPQALERWTTILDRTRASSGRRRGMRAFGQNGSVALCVVTPLYAELVDWVACRIGRSGRITAVDRDPLSHASLWEAGSPWRCEDWVEVPSADVVDEIALAVLATPTPRAVDLRPLASVLDCMPLAC